MDTGVFSHLADNTVHQFTRDNDVSVEFDAYGFSVKDYQTGRLLLRCDSTVTQQPLSQTPVVLLSFSKHAKLLFYNSESSVDSVFEIIHSDIWTSPIRSKSGIKYYAIFLDYFLHFVWIYPLHKKSDLFDNFVAFRAYVNKQFNVDIKALQCNHGGEYDNTRFHNLFRQNDIQFQFSRPRTLQQNGKSERMLRIINNLIRTLIFQAYIPPSYWVETLNMDAHLLNILPFIAINNEIPFTKLYNQTPTYEHLRIFGCLCYPHVDVSHKLEPRFTSCIFLGYPANHRGYRSYDFLLPPIQTTTNVLTTKPFVQHMDEPNNLITPHPTTLPTGLPQPDTPPSHSSTPIPPQPDTYPSYSLTPIPTSAQTQSHAQTIDNHTSIPINNSSQTMPTHPMVTRAKAGIFKLLELMNCHVTTNSPLSCSHVHALRDPNWKEAMLDEYNALITNGTWVLVPRPTNVNVVHSMWLFKHKFNADGSLSRYKARLVANGRSQQQEEILERAHMQNYNPCRTLVDTESKLGLDGDPVSDPTLYHSLADALQYLTFTRPDLSYAVQQVCLYMHDPHEPHCTALKCILHYVRDTLDYGLQLHVSSTTQLSAYTDADWAGCPVTRRSTSGYCMFLGENLLSWSGKRQVTLSRSSAEPEYRGVANVVAETTWIRNLLCELHTPLFTDTLVYHDNVNAVYMSTNPVQHQHTKHIQIDIYFVRDFVASGQVRVLHVPSRFQYVDIFTKGLPTALFIEFRSSLNVRRSPSHNEREY
nr:ribonuclease H-like domain-containing protein [Tanacetum cinerariifolium]